MADKKEPILLDFDNPPVDFNELELKLIQPCHLASGLRQITPQIQERAREIAKRNRFDYYMFVESIRDDDYSRPGFLGNIHYYNKKDKLTQVYPSLKIRDN